MLVVLCIVHTSCRLGHNNQRSLAQEHHHHLPSTSTHTPLTPVLVLTFCNLHRFTNCLFDFTDSDLLHQDTYSRCTFIHRFRIDVVIIGIHTKTQDIPHYLFLVSHSSSSLCPNSFPHSLHNIPNYWGPSVFCTLCMLMCDCAPCSFSPSSC